MKWYEYIGLLAFLALFFLVLVHATPQEERYQCFRLTEQQKEYPNFYATKAEKEMCAQHGVML